LRLRLGFALLAAWIALSGICRTAGAEAETKTDLAGRKAVFVIAAEGFGYRELAGPSELLRERGCAVTIACSTLDPARSTDGTYVRPDVLLKNVKADAFDAIVFVGGVGAKEYFEDETAFALARDAESRQKILAAIGIAPAILARAGVLVGKHASSWRSQRLTMIHRGARWLDAPLFQDGNILTANRPGVAERFGEALARALAERRP